MREAALVGAEGRGGHAEKLAQERVVVGAMLEPIIVGLEAEGHDAQHHDLPEVEAGAASGFFAREDFGFEQPEDFRLQRGVRPDPLQAGQDRRPFVAALAREDNFFNGPEPKFRLAGERLAQGKSEWDGVDGAFLL